MGNKIALILSLGIVSIFFLLAGDTISLQYFYSDLDAKGTTISYLISKTGRTDDEFKKQIYDRYDVTLTFKNTTTPKIGDVVDFAISKNFDPIIISTSTMVIKVERSAMIGYFG